VYRAVHYLSLKDIGNEMKSLYLSLGMVCSLNFGLSLYGLHPEVLSHLGHSLSFAATRSGEIHYG
jgi:hypothetical protein